MSESKRRTLRILESPHFRTGHILLDHPALHPVHVSRSVDFRNERAGLVCGLRAREDVEVVVGGVSARVTLGAYCRAKDDEVSAYVSDCAFTHASVIFGGG